ncbi:TetR/AcrR family transcriptional regulator C-terminal domain-containing protein [Lysobacter sp. S4-A87]|uniref:TetR/AcrR family transcriptional regulator C-terminal domain-containing protein n=1 Tax=Lysobacter sp. S4-A87 TaxID=2925843 RepID=UPI001F533EF4|nr:TetR/AcrR family transcriptional regulator C-terminal domain-containing protein [Lysobacter sp. S4-A87]UNK48709.1 TetR/AcrR family transcriptional regulator C-terminal domain-containing protein [Lysobacter sp. S4-A87]
MTAIEEPTRRPSDRRCAILQEVSDALRMANDGATSIEAFLAGTSVSQREVIDEFGSMDDLVIALVENIVAFMLEPLDESPTEATFMRQLVAYGRRVTDEYADLRLKNLYRIAITDTIRDSRMKGEFYRRGPHVVQSELARFFRSAQLAGVRLDLDSRRLAGHFMAYLRVGWDLSGTGPQADGSQPADGVGRRVEGFLKGIRPESNDACTAVHDQR